MGPSWCHSDRRGRVRSGAAGGCHGRRLFAGAVMCGSGGEGRAKCRERLFASSAWHRTAARGTQFVQHARTGLGRCRVAPGADRAGSVQLGPPAPPSPRRPRAALPALRGTARPALQLPAPPPAARVAVRKVTQFSLPPRGVGRECESRLAGARPALQRAGQQEARTARARRGGGLLAASPSAMEAEEKMECIQEFPEHYKVILDRLNEQREQDQFTDITLIVDGHHFKAHKAVLAACSQFFYRFFQDFTQEPLVEIEGNLIHVDKSFQLCVLELVMNVVSLIQAEMHA
uniref:BTB domain-containing protein n=1 Tax=Phasianus colchicus TaxID=9054 RepID=A0A669QF20_PHACC